MPRCASCLDDGHVCENHPTTAWPDGCDCGMGMPCPACCSPIPQDGTGRIIDAFTPDWKRTEQADARA